MTITPKTTVHTLLKEYPFLLEYLAAYHPEFGKLTNPVLRRTMGRMATLDKAAQLANVPLNQLMNDVAGEIQAKTGARPSVADAPGVDTVDPAREPGSAAGHRFAAQGRRGHRRAAGAGRVGAAQDRAGRHAHRLVALQG